MAAGTSTDPATVLVAGASGYMGRHIVQALADSGYRVRPLAREQRSLAPVAQYCDEVFIGQATRPDTLDGLCHGVDAVISALGLRTLRSRPTAEQVDLGANRNILAQAQSAGVNRFVFIGVLHGRQLMPAVPILRPRERFIAELTDTELAWTVLRPTGAFNDMKEIFQAARRGWVPLIGDGSAQVNPVHPADIAQVAVEALNDVTLHRTEFGFGGPDVFSYQEITGLAARVLGKQVRTVCLPYWPIDLITAGLRPFNGNAAGFLAFFRQVMSRDLVGWQLGHHRLDEFFQELL